MIDVVDTSEYDWIVTGHMIHRLFQSVHRVDPTIIVDRCNEEHSLRCGDAASCSGLLSFHSDHVRPRTTTVLTRERFSLLTYVLSSRANRTGETLTVACLWTHLRCENAPGYDGSARLDARARVSCCKCTNSPLRPSPTIETFSRSFIHLPAQIARLRFARSFDSGPTWTCVRNRVINFYRSSSKCCNDLTRAEPIMSQ